MALYEGGMEDSRRMEAGKSSWRFRNSFMYEEMKGTEREYHLVSRRGGWWGALACNGTERGGSKSRVKNPKGSWKVSERGAIWRKASNTGTVGGGGRPRSINGTSWYKKMKTRCNKGAKNFAKKKKLGGKTKTRNRTKRENKSTRKNCISCASGESGEGGIEGRMRQCD